MPIKSKMTLKTLRSLEKITGKKLTLGNCLWSIREAEGELQVDFARKLGISKQQLCDIEHNRKIVSAKLAASYAEKLGYSAEQFIRLALQDAFDRDGLNFFVEIIPKKKSKAIAWSEA